jgi:FKBP-type peptidyl-prolyl cis-trans isomerase
MLLGGLSACYVGPTQATECTPGASSGNASEAVQATGSVLSQPTVSFPTPLRPRTTEATTIDRGNGEVIGGDQYVSGYITILNGTTGEVIQQSDYQGTPEFFSIDRVGINGLQQGLQCAQVDSRVAVVVPGREAFTDENRPGGFTEDDSLVVVVDFKEAFLGRAQGTAQVAQNGMPSVVLAPDGRPGITVPKDPAPKKLRVANLIIGNGDKVKEGDTVLVNYTGVLWDSGDVFDSSWENGRPAQIEIKDGQVIPGFLDAMKGKKVGDQVLAVIPPDQGYGDQAQGTIPANSTLVFVIDILGIVE